MSTHLQPLAAVFAAMAGAMVAVVVMNGPLWLLVPGAMGALLPLAWERRLRGHEDVRGPDAHAATDRARLPHSGDVSDT